VAAVTFDNAEEADAAFETLLSHFVAYYVAAV
jgi:hypothetical protein